jgi:transglutaminase-like putative cysteine protease
MKIQNILFGLLLWPALANAKIVELRQSFKPKLINDSGVLFVPVPQEIPGYQKVISQEITGNAATPSQIVLETTKATPASAVRAEWTNVKEPSLEIVTKVEIQDRKEIAAPKASSKEFLLPTAHIQIDGIVKTQAQKIVGKTKDADIKARLIYDWIIDHAARDPKVSGCGLGDVKTMLESGNLSGKCADLNSLFVGLARAQGIPARETFGVRATKPDVSNAQHCRAEFYSMKQKAWIPVDPADVLKFALEDKLSPTDAKFIANREKYFGTWEGNWLAFNSARDFKIEEGSEKISVNYFMYPTLISEKFRPSGYNPDEVGYKLTITNL